MERVYPKDYLALQVNFAKRARQLEGSTFTEALYRYTSVRRMCNLPYSADSDDQTVREITEASLANNPTEDLYQIYLRRKGITYPQGSRIGSGCIQIEEPNNTGLFHIHLSLGGSGDNQPFSPNNLSQRKGELKNVIDNLVDQYGDRAKTGGGFSWLMGPLRVSGIFPPEFHRDAVPKVWYGNLALWGQFLDGDLRLKTYMAEQLLANTAKCSRIEDLYSCFKYPVLEARAPIQAFIKHLT